MLAIRKTKPLSFSLYPKRSGMPLTKSFLCTLFILLSSFSTSQLILRQGDFVDTRDGKTYQTFTLDSRVWIAENMKFKTPGAEIHDENDQGIKPDGYFYPFQEINEVCPCEFRIPTTSDWEAYFAFLLELKNISDLSTEYVGFDKRDEHFVACDVSDNQLKPFQEPNPLQLKDHGHTQDGELVGIGSMNFWIKHYGSADPKYHLHLMRSGFNIHSHEHHITKKKRKLRKFSVRCVKDLELD